MPGGGHHRGRRECHGRRPLEGRDQHTFEARLDRAALVAAVVEELPAGFAVSHVNEGGSLSVEWTGQRETPSKREHGAILKAIVAEELVIDDDRLITEVPSRERVLERAVELGLSQADAENRLDRLVTLDVLNVADGEVWPDDNFSRD